MFIRVANSQILLTSRDWNLLISDLEDPAGLPTPKSRNPGHPRNKRSVLIFRGNKNVLDIDAKIKNKLEIMLKIILNSCIFKRNIIIW